MKQIVVAFTPLIGQGAGTDSLLLERISKKVFDAGKSVV